VERIDLAIKAGIAFLMGVVSMSVGLVGVVFTALIGLMILDFITALMAASVTGEGWKSSKGYKGLFKKSYTIILIGGIFIIEVSVLKTNGIVTDGISAAYCVMELISLIENGGKMGAPIPNKLRKLITTLKNTVGENEEEKKDEKK
jgi:toxin secretion/phage lysis holin